MTPNAQRKAEDIAHRIVHESFLIHLDLRNGREESIKEEQFPKLKAEITQALEEFANEAEDRVRKESMDSTIMGAHMLAMVHDNGFNEGASQDAGTDS